MKNILIIGGTGFIGSHLVEKLWHEGYKIAVLVRKDSNLKFISKFKGIELRQGDLLGEDSLNKALFKIDTVFCMVNVKPSGKTKKEYEKQLDLLHNKGTKNLIKACKKRQVKRLIYLSSVAAIGYRKDIDTYNESSETNPGEAYGKAKLKAENILKESLRKKEIEVTIIRPVAVFGERGLGPLKKIIFFINKGVVPILGSGNNLQSISYVGNIINEAVLLAQNNSSIGKIYIATDKKPYSVNTLVDTVGKTMKKHYLKIHLPLWLLRGTLGCINFLGKVIHKGDLLSKENFIAISTQRIFDGSKIFREFSYKQKYDLMTGVKQTIGWLNHGKKT